MGTSSASPPTTQVGGHGLLVTSPDQWLCSSDHHDHGDDNPGGGVWWGDGAGQCVSEDLLSRPGPSSHRRQCSRYLVGHRVSCQLRWLETKAAIYRYFSILILKHCSESRPASETFWKWVQQFSYKVNLIFQQWCLWTFLQIFKRVTIIWLILHSATSNIHPMWIFMYYCFLVLFKYTNSGILEMRLVYTVNRLLICLNISYKCWFPNLFIWGGHNYSFDLIVLWQMDNGQHITGIIFTSTPCTNVSKLVWCVHLWSRFPHEVFNGQK